MPLSLFQTVSPRNRVNRGEGRGASVYWTSLTYLRSGRGGSNGRATPRTLLRARADDGPGRQCQGANPGCSRRRRASRVAPRGGIRRGGGARGDPLLGYCEARLWQDLKIGVRSRTSEKTYPRY